MPYIPGLLSFRETPAIIEALKKINKEPDVILIDGQGIAHPRSFGIASHIGVIYDKPAIGVAKSKLIGEFNSIGDRKGEYSFLIYKNKIIGAALRTKNNVKPIFVSIGNKITLEKAIEITLKFCTKYRLPEPVRLAHIYVTKYKNNFERN